MCTSLYIANLSDCFRLRFIIKYWVVTKIFSPPAQHLSLLVSRVWDGMRSRGAWSWGVQEGEEEGQWAWMLDLQDTWWTDGALDSRNRPAVAACRTTRRERERTEVCFTDPEPEYCIGHKFRGIWISRMTVIMAFTDLIFTKKCQHRYAHNKFLLSRF